MIPANLGSDRSVASQKGTHRGSGALAASLATATGGPPVLPGLKPAAGCVIMSVFSGRGVLPLIGKRAEMKKQKKEKKAVAEAERSIDTIIYTLMPALPSNCKPIVFNP